MSVTYRIAINEQQRRVLAAFALFYIVGWEPPIIIKGTRVETPFYSSVVRGPFRIVGRQTALEKRLYSIVSEGSNALC